MFVHTVYFWLKDEVSQSEIDDIFTDCEILLTKIPSVRHIWWGVPANTPRDVVDNTYQIGICVVYDDKAGHDEYQAHPLHKQFVAKHSSKWSNVKAYDFI